MSEQEKIWQKNLKKAEICETHQIMNTTRTRETLMSNIQQIFLALAVRQKVFHFQTYNDKVAFKNYAVGFLSRIYSTKKRKANHLIQVTCASKLFDLNMKEELITEQTNHVSNTLFNHEKTSSEQEETVFNILGTCST